jgi:hypothetical protein
MVVGRPIEIALPPAVGDEPLDPAPPIPIM